MTEAWERTLEQALSRTEADANAAIQAAATVTSALRRVRKAAKTGDTKTLAASLEVVGVAQTRLGEQIANSKEGWDFDVETYMGDGLYLRELLEAGRKGGLEIHESDGRLFSYPSVVRLSPKERAVYVNRKRDFNIRPSALMSRLKREQQNPPAFRPQSFLESLYKAYRTLAVAGGASQNLSPEIPLLRVYELFTLLPGQSNDYGKQDFVRDVYRLHVSGVAQTRDGATMLFPSGTWTKSPRQRLPIVTETGEMRIYTSIRFVAAPRRRQDGASHQR